MHRTKELFTQVIDAILNGNLEVNNLLSEDISSCFIHEIDLASLLYLDENKTNIKQETQRLVDKLYEECNDTKRFISIVESMILCIDLISEMKSWFVNTNHWLSIHGNNNPEINSIIEYFEDSGEVNAISNIFVNEYSNVDIPVFFNKDCGMNFVLHNGKRMYFPKDYDVDRVIEYYKGILIEQDKRSPHYYSKDGYCVKQGDIVVDAGVAEGNFSLEIIDVASHIYMIEADECWIEALRETFRDYNSKVTIIKGYLSDEMNEDYVSLDGILMDKGVNFIKMDIEGYERKALIGAEGIISKSQSIRCAICSYHHNGDEKWIRKFFDGMFMENTTSDGYMVPVWERSAYHDCEVRRGIVFGRK